MPRWLFIIAIVAWVFAPSAAAVTIYGVNLNSLQQFDSASPTTVTSNVAISGLQGNEIAAGIDCRPSNGTLYLLAATSGAPTALRVLTLDPATGATTPVGSLTLNGTEFGFDVNPVANLIRIVSDVGENRRFNPANGATTPDTSLNWAPGDPNAAATPMVVGSAYTNNVPGATTTTLYGIDAGVDYLVTQNPPNDGTLTSVGALAPANAGSLVGFDISSAGSAFMTTVRVGPDFLPRTDFWTVNLTSGAATLVGEYGEPTALAGITAACGATAVRLRGFDASRSGTRVMLRWSTASEAGTIGFNLYREVRGKRVRLNSWLLPATFLGGGHSYSFVDRRTPRSRATYRLQSVALDGTRSWLGVAAVAGA